MKWFTHPPEVYWRAFYRWHCRRLRRIPEAEQKCLNCGTSYHGNYCPVCGQSCHTKSLTLLHILRNFWLSIVMLRKGYVLTLLELTGHPAYFMRHYIQGHRVPYVHPFRLLLVLLAAYLLLSQAFMSGQLSVEKGFGFTSYLQSVQTNDWRQMVAQYLIIALQYIHKTPLLQMGATRFENWFFQEPAYQSLTLFPFFALLSYTLFHSGNSEERNEALSDEGQGNIEEKTPSFFDTTIKEPLGPLWSFWGVIQQKLWSWSEAGMGKFRGWWISNFGHPVVFLKIWKVLKLLFHKAVVLCQKCFKEIKFKRTRVVPLTYDFVEVVYMRGYFTCLLMEVNLLLFFWGMYITPFNPWVIVGTIWIYKHFFRWGWWEAVRRTVYMYLLMFFLMGLYCMTTSIMDVVRG